MLILHGDNPVASRQALLDTISQARTTHQNVLELPGGTLTLSDLTTTANSSTLLGETNFLVIPELFARRPGKEKNSLLDYLKHHPDAAIVVWESKNVASQLIGFSPAAIRQFALPKYLFKFLDHFSLDLLQQTLATTPPELLFVLLTRRLHDLILAQARLLTGPAWKTDALRRQAAIYSPTEIISLYQDLLFIDFAQKTSASAHDLTAALELWVIKALR